MRFAKTLLPCLCLVIALFAFGVPGKTLPRTNDEPQPANDKAETAHYPDFGFLPPRKRYVGRVFRLSQAHPKDLPPAEPELWRVQLRSDPGSVRTPDAGAINRWVRGANVKFVDRQS